MFGDGIIHPSYAFKQTYNKKGINSKIRTNKYDLNSYLEFAKLPGPKFLQILNIMATFVITASTIICPLLSCMLDITITKYYFPT